MKVFLEYFCFFLEKMSPFMRVMGSCALLGNLDSPTIEMQFFVTIINFVLSLYEIWLIARL